MSETDITPQPGTIRPDMRVVVSEEVERAILPLLAHFEEIKTTVSETRAEVKSVKSCLESDVTGTPGVLERIRILETSDKIRNRTVWGAAAAVGSAILHTIWQAVTKVAPGH